MQVTCGQGDFARVGVPRKLAELPIKLATFGLPRRNLTEIAQLLTEFAQV